MSPAARSFVLPSTSGAASGFWSIEPWHELAAAWRAERGQYVKPLQPVSAPSRIGLGLAFFALFVALWSVATFGGYVQQLFLADPLTMLGEGYNLLVLYGFSFDIAMTIWRVVGGFILAVIVALPLGILMGAYKPIEAFFEPFVSFARYLPASAFIPLLILWAGIGEAQKLLVIFIGSVFQLILMIAVAVGSIRRDLVDAAYTLGAGDRSVVMRVLLPNAAPEIAEILRMVLGWAWTYVIVAELIGSSSGIGHMITDSQALLNTGQIIFGIIVIGLIGLISDFLFKAVNQRLFPWAREMSKLVIDQVGKSFPARHGGQATRALLPTSLSVADNDFITILGPSGCGKSTLLRMIGGLETPTEGRILLDGEPVTGPGADRGFVFQSYTLFPWLTVAAEHRLRPAREGRARGRAPAHRRRLGRAHRPQGLREPLSRSSSPAACSSARRSPGRSPTIQRSCCSTSPSARSTTRPAP